MFKLLSSISILTLAISSMMNIVACQSEKGNIVPMYYYNIGKFNHATADNKKKYKDEKDSGKIYKNSLNNSNISIQRNIVIPLMYGFNLTKDNNLGIKGAKWTIEQVANGLQAKKNEIINIAATIGNKELWTYFYNNYSTTDDSFYTQIGLVGEKNHEIYDNENKKILTQTSNYNNVTNKDNVEQHGSPTSKPYYLTIKNTLNVFPPIKQTIDWLNDPNNNYNTQREYMEKSILLQSTRYVLLELPSINFTFEFTNKNNIFTFDVKVNHVAAIIKYLGYKNPHDSDGKTFGYQWFFTGYEFFNMLKYKNDDTHVYNVKLIPGVAENIKFAIGFVNPYKPFISLTEDKAKKIDKDVGKFKHKKTGFTIPDLEWTIEVNSITKEY